MGSKLQTTVIIIRHAEKLPWDRGLTPHKDVKAAYIDNHVLSAKGYERAQAFVAYFQCRQEMAALLRARPWGAVIAQDVDSEGGWGKSERPRETVDPLMRAPTMKDVPFILYKKSDADHMVNSILSGKYCGKTVLISWCHQMIPELAKQLGIPPSSVPEWDKKRFDVTWVLNLDGRNSSFTQIPQRLLYGDLDVPMPV
ncbi:hypothetical protein PhCBS80983_g03056 [Powellomyces hirtus]|uniref:Phosphoglycerate mutase n=1 Tax=Powellomyces hirtus TaxID=109895 RepID=A0A507E679_9FUNG|nr:hypothetical protein PhCBS80983_g03056 [Powellomyces hirtus]